MAAEEEEQILGKSEPMIKFSPKLEEEEEEERKKKREDNKDM